MRGETRLFELKITSDNGDEVRPPCITVRSTGATLVLDRLFSRAPLLPALKEAFPESWELILSFAYFILKVGYLIPARH
ncbi:MAG TPA: hypothetical protein IAB18_09650 [Candidatus Avisuccinivibrio pullicola]|nr:hypothetical protein [Candidatus Avisuccinivibrio pullicola]